MPKVRMNIFSGLFLLALLTGLTFPISSSSAYALINLNTKADSAITTEDVYTQDTVVVKYKERGRFLALVPITLTVTAVAHADGAVELYYPWYSRLTIDKEREAKDSVKIAVDNTIRAQAVGSVRGEGESPNPTWNAEQSVEITEAIESALQSVPNAEVTVD